MDTVFTSLSLATLIPLFITAAAAVWFAGIQLSITTDIIDNRLNLGEALGGLIFLSIATNLPETAIIISASIHHNVGIAIGNILGGIGIQTVVLVLLDGIGLKNKAALTYQAASLQLVLEATLVIIILVICIMAAQLPKNIIVDRLAPGDLMILVTWLTGLWLINKARTHLPWHEKGRAPNIIPINQSPQVKKRKQWSTPFSFFIFSVASIITLIAGSVLEESGSAIADKIHWSGVLFGSTILAAITSLPEISTGLGAIRLGEYTLAMSDIFGGNAFLPVLFILSTLISGESVLPQAQTTDIYLASLGALLTAIYIVGLIFRPKRQYFNLGIDSIIVLILYIVGIIGLFAIS